MNTFIKSMLFAAAALFAQVSPAAYLDLGLGNSTVEIDDFEGSDTYFKVAIGGEISDNITAEGGFWNLGEAEDAGVEVSADGLFGDVKFSHDLNSDTSIFGKLGLFMWDGEACAGVCASDDGNDMFYGAGVGFAVGSGTVNIEILMSELGADLGDFDVTTIGGSYSIPFGK
ncbi:MAG TPA: outer membrane beta-barrel protein [Gammaproteobacteria bacterium]